MTALAGDPIVKTAATGTPIDTDTVSPGANELLVAVVASRRTATTHSISGLGLTWTPRASIVSQDGTSGRHQLTVWTAPTGETAPAPGAVSVTLANNTTSIVVIVFRLTGIDPDTPIESAISFDTEGAADDDMKLAITTATNMAWAIGFGSHRTATFTTPGGQTSISINQVAGSGSEATRLSAWYIEQSPAGTATLGADNDLSAATNWIMAVMSVAPTPPPDPPAPLVSSPARRLRIAPTTPPTVHAYDPLLRGSRYLHDLTGSLSVYEHEIEAMGGYWSAQVRMNDQQSRLEDWYEQGLGRHIVSVDSDGQTVWEGLVNRVTLYLGGVTKSVGPLVDIANRVRLVYSYIDASGELPELGLRLTTDWAEDARSQEKWGVLERVLAAGGLTPENADGVRDAYLRENAQPVTDEDQNIGGGDGPTMQLDCLGYVHFLSTYVYTSGASGQIDLSGKLINVLDAEPNGFIRHEWPFVTGNNLPVAAQDNDNRVAWNIVKALVGLGDEEDNRYLFGIYANRMAHYAPVADSISYNRLLSDPAQRVTTPGGQTILPWNVLPGRWMFSPDFLVGRVPKNTELRVDPRAQFIESVAYRAPWSLSIRGGNVRRLGQKLAKLGLAGIGG